VNETIERVGALPLRALVRRTDAAAVSSIRVGSLAGDVSQPAFIIVEELLSKHFAVLGATGSGKSCAVALLLRRMLAKMPNAHMLLLDLHNEYASAFGDSAVVVNLANTRMPFWALSLESSARILVQGGPPAEQHLQITILEEAIVKARKEASNLEDTSWITVDTPLPYLIQNLRRNVNAAMGGVNNVENVGPHRRLLARLDSLIGDRRFAFMFGDYAIDTLSEDIGALVRIPVNGRPVTIVDMSTVPAAMADVVVAVLAKMIFQFAFWCEPEHRVPILLVCEDAHQYLPATEGTTYAACTRNLSRIISHGRKYGLSLALVSDRPSDLSPRALAQCGTVLALRLRNRADRLLVEENLNDDEGSLKRILGRLPDREAIIFGDGVAAPMHVRFDDLEAENRPSGGSARFLEAWQSDSPDVRFRDQAIERWRRELL
jgi:DNA helicase HerA-like ATPase